MIDMSSQAGERYGECRFVSDFIHEQVRWRIERHVREPKVTHADEVAMIFGRVMTWMHSLGKLNEPEDFQAVTAGARALLEIAVDLTLVHFDPASNPIGKLVAWEDSAKLKAAQRAGDFIEGPDSTLEETTQWRPFIAQIVADAPRVEALRATHWPDKNGKGRHPMRWTGNDLASDVDTASALFPRGLFGKIYAMRYAQQCWHTHGSGLAGLRGMTRESLPRLSMLAFMECAHFGMVAAELTLRELRAWEAVAEAAFAQHDRTRQIELARRLGGARAPAR